MTTSDKSREDLIRDIEALGPVPSVIDLAAATAAQLQDLLDAMRRPSYLRLRDWTGEGVIRLPGR